MGEDSFLKTNPTFNLKLIPPDSFQILSTLKIVKTNRLGWFALGTHSKTLSFFNNKREGLSPLPLPIRFD